MKAKNPNYYLLKPKTGCNCSKDVWCSLCLHKKVAGQLYSGKSVDHELAIKLSTI